ncbi:hypothetical protein GCM10010160_35680 [Acrocarpospora corrugata]
MPDWSGADLIVATARRAGQAVRGHTLVWGEGIPAWVTGGGFTAASSGRSCGST